MQKPNKLIIKKLNELGLIIHRKREELKKKKLENSKRKTLKNLKKKIKKIFKKDTVVKVILVLATASLLIPLLIPFLG